MWELNQENKGTYHRIAVVTCKEAAGTRSQAVGQGLDQEDTQVNESEQKLTETGELWPKKGEAGRESRKLWASIKNTGFKCISSIWWDICKYVWWKNRKARH